MPIRVEIEGRGVAEFPDDTPEDVIDKAVKRDFFNFREIAPEELRGTTPAPAKPTEILRGLTERELFSGRVEKLLGPSMEKAARLVSSPFRAVFGTETGPRTESLLGIDTKDIPEGETPIGKVGRAVEKTAKGFGEFLTSPKGMVQMAGERIPVAGLAVRAKWIYDLMASVGQGSSRLSELLSKPDKTSADWQAIADETVAAVAQAVAAGHLTSKTAEKVTGIRAPLTRGVEELIGGRKSVLGKDVAVALGAAEKPGMPDPGLVAANIAAPGTMRPQEIRGEFIREPDAPAEMVQWSEALQNELSRLPVEVQAQPGVVSAAQELLAGRERAKALGGGGRLPEGEPFPAAGEVTPGFLQTAEQRITRRGQPVRGKETILSEITPKQLRTVEEILRRQLEIRDWTGAVSTLAKLPAEVSRTMADKLLGVGKEAVPLSASERTIFNEIWEAAVRRSLGGEPPSEPGVEPAKPPSPKPKGGPSASGIQEATEVHGNVRAQPVEGAREVPAEGSGKRVQPQETSVPSQIESVPITKPPVAGTEVKPAGAQAGVRGEVKTAEPVAKSPAEMNPREFDEFAKTTPLESQIHSANRFPTRDEAIAAINAVEASRESPGAFRPQRIGDQWMIVASHPAFIAEAVRQKQPVSAVAIQAYQYKLPKGYVREGDLQVYKPQPPAKPAAKEAVASRDYYGDQAAENAARNKRFEEERKAEAEKHRISNQKLLAELEVERQASTAKEKAEVTAGAGAGKIPAAVPAKTEGSGRGEGARGPNKGLFLDDSFSQEKAGYPKAKEALMGWSNQELAAERAVMMKASLGTMFGRNASRTLKLIEDEIAARKTQSAPETQRVMPGEGIVSGGALEKWADAKIKESSKRLHAGIDPELLAAYVVKGAALFERGVIRFADWSADMIRQFGDTIKPHLDDLYVRAAKLSKDPEAYHIEGDSLKMRKSAERATTSPQIPEPVQERIAQSPESFYKQQPMAAVEEVVGRMSDAELAAVPPESNFHVAARLTLSTRLLEAGKLEEGYQVFKGIAAEGTALGQNINQFKFLKGQSPLNYMRLVNEGLKEAGKDPLTKEQATKLTKIGTENIESAKKLEKAKRDWQKDPTDANAKLAEDALTASDKASLDLQKEMSRYQVQNWPKMLKAFAQGNPLTPISHVANFLGNSLGAGLEASARTMAQPLDVIRAAITGGERKIKMQPVAGTAEAAKGYGRGLAKAPGILARGPGQTVKGDVRAALRPLVALRNAFAKNPDVPTVEGRVPFGERARLAVEGTFGIAPEAMLRLLSAADKPAFESARARLIGEQLGIQKVPRANWPFAQKFPELFIKPEDLKRINMEAQEAIFQQPSRGVNALNSLIRQWGGDWADLAFTIAVAPYRLTPWNLIKFTLQYNPLWAAFKTARESAAGNTRAAELNAGRMLVGGMLYTAGYFLYKNGLVGPSLDERDESAKARLLSGEVLPPNHVNVSGLKRLMSGEDPSFKAGDETWDLTRGGGAAGAIITSVANIGRDFEKQPAEDQQWLGSLLQNSTLQQASFTVNQSFLKGVTGILDAVRDRNLRPYMNGVENMLLNVATPNTLSAISRATREYAPDMRSETLARQFENVIRNRFGFAGLDDYLPVKRDLWGKPMLQTPKDRNAILYHLFDISKGKQVTDDPVALELYSLWRTTSDTRAIPSIPARTLTFAAKTYNLTTDQYSRYSELVGQNRRAIAEALVKNPNWQNAPEQTRITILDRAYDAGQEVGKAQFYTEFQGKLSENPKKTGFNP